VITRYTVDKIQKIWSQEYKLKLMLKIELLVLEALSREGKIPSQVLKRIKKKAKFNLENIQKIEQKTHHDIVAFVLEVCSYLGEDARYFHWGLTSNDLLDTSLGVQLKQSTFLILKDLDLLKKEVIKKATQYKHTLCVARTHGVHAEVYLLGLKFVVLLEELLRAESFIQKAYKEVSVGKISGAVGTYAYLNPQVENYVLKKLGLKPAGVTTQVISRTRISTLLFSFSLLAGILERFATEIRHLQRTEVGELFEPFYKGQKGSSSMPHKRNPIVCERICGMARLLRGYLITSLENISLWHERDISHSSTERVILPDATNLIDYMILKMTQIIKDLEVDTSRMLKNLGITRGMIFSQGLLLSLMEKGIPRPQAYDIVQEISFKCKRKGSFEEEAKKHPFVKRLFTAKELKDIFSPSKYLKNVDSIYQRFRI